VGKGAHSTSQHWTAQRCWAGRQKEQLSIPVSPPQQNPIQHKHKKPTCAPLHHCWHRPPGANPLPPGPTAPSWAPCAVQRQQRTPTPVPLHIHGRRTDIGMEGPCWLRHAPHLRIQLQPAHQPHEVQWIRNCRAAAWRPAPLADASPAALLLCMTCCSSSCCREAEPCFKPHPRLLTPADCARPNPRFRYQYDASSP
jgi:hypothetical protein